MEKSSDKAKRLIYRAKRNLELFGRNAYALSKLADYVINRKN
jgi:geranylgeranyl pyrophosphate synthase